MPSGGGDIIVEPSPKSRVPPPHFTGGNQVGKASQSNLMGVAPLISLQLLFDLRGYALLILVLRRKSVQTKENLFHSRKKRRAMISIVKCKKYSGIDQTARLPYPIVSYYSTWKNSIAAPTRSIISGESSAN